MTVSSHFPDPREFFSSFHPAPSFVDLRVPNHERPSRVSQERKAYFREFVRRGRGAVDGRLGRDCTAVGEVPAERRAICRWYLGAAVATLGLSVEIQWKRRGLRYVERIVDSFGVPLLLLSLPNMTDSHSTNLMPYALPHVYLLVLRSEVSITCPPLACIIQVQEHEQSH